MQTNKLFYQKSIQKYGISAQGVHWNNEYTQYKRFEIITNFIKDDLDNSLIVDAGCGFGEYLKYLKSHECKNNFQYIGIDCENEMIRISQNRFSDAKFYQKDVLVDQLIDADYYICSGAMNILPKQKCYQFIENCFRSSKKGFVFNFLKNKSFNNIKIEEVVAFCSSLSSKLQTKNNYLENDFTIFMIK